MTAEDLVAWIEKEGLSDVAAAKALGISRNSLAKYKAEGAPIYIGLACAAISFGLPPWKAVR